MKTITFITLFFLSNFVFSDSEFRAEFIDFGTNFYKESTTGFYYKISFSNDIIPFYFKSASFGNLPKTKTNYSFGFYPFSIKKGLFFGFGLEKCKELETSSKSFDVGYLKKINNNLSFNIGTTISEKNKILFFGLGFPVF